MIVAAAFAAPEFGLSPWAGAALAAALWYAIEALLASVAGWPLSWRSLPAWMARDLLLPLLWGEGWRGDNFVWRGNAMTVDEQALREAPSGPPPQM